ncbi:hypothetical protein N7481_006306 [Penicillium waksmanii]|uniref:uncharacterized protein n=1 Tax=Penicillium waksmanii TaxID=69791 RepID=UPI002549716D|nr:uncharacterized protein N7481_006306 [Penicillium waksmanii]KAJ5984207.1 hypothetical protein N7481_006306 [Penicillium waksmanii]
MLNTLANHGYLPHDGKDISEEQTITALGNVLNIDKEFATALFQNGVSANPEKNATTFSLSDLTRHNVVEHDASMSRQDFYFGNDHTFNKAAFDETRSYWKGSLIDIQSAANARQARIKSSKAMNPTFDIPESILSSSFGEAIFLIVVMGDKAAGTVQKIWVEYLFENERLPFELGWTKASDEISAADFSNMTKRIQEATESSESSQQTTEKVCEFKRHIGSHARRQVKH